MEPQPGAAPASRVRSDLLALSVLGVLAVGGLWHAVRGRSPRAPGAQTRARAAPRPAALSEPKPKTPGRWVVDAASGDGSDSSDLGKVLAAAKAGDKVVLRPGIYTQGAELFIGSDLSVLREPKSSGDVVIQGNKGYSVLSVRSARLSLEGVTIKRLPGGDGGSAVHLDDAELRLKDSGLIAEAGASLSAANSKVRAERGLFKDEAAKPSASVIEDGAMICRECVFDRAGIALQGGSKDRSLFSDCVFRGRGAELVVTGGSKVDLKDARFEETGPNRALSAVGESEVRGAGIVFLRTGGGAAYAGDAAKLRLSRVTAEDGTGLSVFTFGGRAEAALSRLVVSRARGAAVTAAGAPAVDLSDCKLMDGGKHGIEALEDAKVAVKNCLIAGNAGNGVYAAGRSAVSLTKTRFERNGRGDVKALEQAAVSGRPAKSR